MFQHQGIWLPDGEKHFPEWMDRNGGIVNGRGTYQYKKIQAALKHCRPGGTAIDVGAHVGFWSIPMADAFSQLHAFEPVPAFRDCWELNMDGRGGLLYPIALGAAAGRVGMKIDPADSGGTHVSGSGDIEMRALDEFDFRDVNFIKIDCEGYELEVLKGARETLARWQPCVIVEQKPHKLGPNFGIKGTPAVDFLRKLGATLRQELGGDYILAW